VSHYFRAIAVDYDGTIADNGQPNEAALVALRRVRGGGTRLVLVTGRILAELVQVFPEAYEEFDAIVAENGAVVWVAGSASSGARALAPPIPRKLDELLAARGAAFRRGEVILALSAGHEDSVREACVRLGLDEQLVRNRSELMLLPRGSRRARV
jgi:hydroxymethylpyrimidine pyrophosphatase-like HAD family hydrolase